ncbi:C39 family peptidase [Pandoraea sputorum]|uniref:C39 family peptidase n=1 Tax=Pandoraea sputorum TaxID=93222 RepID=UPI002AF6ABB2|nr:C39 family peptidase [Pandoraea sputorum]
MSKDYRHKNVPYRSQWANPTLNEKIIKSNMDHCEDPDWINSGFTTPNDYRFWSNRACGIACLESILDFMKIPRPNRRELIEAATSRGAYIKNGDHSVKGLIYEPFCNWIRDSYEIKSFIYENKTFDYVGEFIKKSFMAISSVSAEIRSPNDPNNRKGGHLVLIHGIEGETLYLHNPSGIPPFQQDAAIKMEIAEQFHAGRGIIVETSKQ